MAQPANPRRCGPWASVSIPPQKRRKINQAADSSDAASSGDKTAGGKRSARYQSNSGESALTWFKNANEHVQSDMRMESTYDEEPPFYIGNQEPCSRLPHSNAPSRAFGAMPAGPAVPADSEKEDLREVIDDLTIENKKLKQRLRSHQSRTSRTSSSRAEDKLFEVRVHGMRAEKKRELEMLLKNFASSLEKDTIPSRSTASRSPDQVANMAALSNSGPGGYNVNHVHTDSGYGSNSHSGTRRQATPVASASKDHTIKSYLHDIPDVLLPRESYPMSDKAKMALVVRRLEQLFTGKQASPHDHQQPIQQQEVSKSAADHDRQEDAARSKKRGPEGSREAHILPLGAQISLDVLDAPSPAKNLHSKIKPDEKSISPIEGSADASRCNSPDQRPTRPLDLDIGRAQVAQENLEYIRHLGLQAPSFDQVGNSKSQWIYLNLLTSMAQLHTLNVTPDFVRRAIKKHSTNLELSKDLRQIRWKGGADMTRFSKETEQAIERPSNVEFGSAQGESVGSNHSKTDSGSNGRVSFTPSDDQTSREESSNVNNQNYSTLGTSYSSRPQNSTQGKTASPFDYKPLFHRLKSSHRREVSSMDDSTSSVATESTGLADRMSRSKLSGQNRNGDGVLTFFNNAYFCSDFSADKRSTKSPRRELSGLTDHSNAILGIPQTVEFQESALRHHDACYFAPQFAAKFTPPKHSRLVGFESEAMLAAGGDETQPMEMEASGLGMVVPADNFAIDVKVTREPIVGRHLLKTKSRLQANVPARFQYQVDSAQRIDLRPSRLPSPSYLFFTSSSSSGPDAMDEESDGSESISSADEASPAPLAFLQQFSTDSSRDRGSDEDMEDDSSVDMLRDARIDDPERIAAQERDYLLNHPGAAMMVSRSLAATVGTPSVQENRQRVSSPVDVRSDVDEAGSCDADADADDE